ncbi:hypothetical protein VTO42DRAFT_2288 [Malbranchea cinnamomea]
MPDPVIVIGGGLAGLVATYELTLRKVPVVIVDQENEKNLGGQAFWSLGGLFCVNSSNQKRAGIKDSYALALSDWMNSAAFDREKEDHWPRKWAEAFVNFATNKMESYVKSRGLKFVNVGWAERGSGYVNGHGNSVPRFHLAWGAGPEVVRIFEEPVRAAAKKGLVTFKFRHKVDELVVDDKTGAAIGVRGQILEPTDAERGVATSRKPVDTFELRGSAILIATGGIGGNVEAVKRNWPVERLGPVPRNFVIGVPAHVDGRMIEIAKEHGANVINSDRMWHYTEGLRNWNSIWPDHGIRIIPGPSSLWLDATGKRLPPFLYPGCDTLATLKHIGTTGYDYTWFILNKSIVAKEFALSGSEQNPDLSAKSIYQFLANRIFSSNGTVPVQKFLKHGKDFVVRETLEELVEGMNQLVGDDGPKLDVNDVRRTIESRDAQLENEYTKDAQLMLIRNARLYWPEKYTRVAKPHKILDKRHGPLVAVKLNLLTRKTLGGLETDLSSQVMRPDGTKFPNLYAAGEAAGFGGGGVHGYNALEGTFLGGCIFSGYTAGRAIADLVLESSPRARI